MHVAVLLGCALISSGDFEKNTAGGNGEAGTCVDDRGCSMNGACVNRMCICTPAWRGAACNQLAFVPGPRASGYRQINVRMGNAMLA